MGELSEVPVPASSPACYTIEDDDEEPEVIFISDNLSEEESRDGEEPSSTTSDINGEDETQVEDIGGTVDDSDSDEYTEAGTQKETIESSDSGDEDEGSGNVLNDFIKLIDAVKSYEQVDKTVKTKFKDGFLFLENLQTQFEDTERNISEKDELIAELIAENNKLQGENKQLKGEMCTQSIQLGMLRNKYAKMEEEFNSLKISEKKVDEPPVVQMPTNLALEAIKFKADELQQLFKQLCTKMKEETVISNDPESVQKSKDLKSFQNEVGVLFIQVQHKLSKWSKNQIKMEEELERCRMSLEQLHDMLTSSSQMKVMSPAVPTPVVVVESSTSQPENKKRKLPPPPLVPLNIPVPKCISDKSTTVNQQQNIISPVPLPVELPMSSSHSPVPESGTNFDGNGATQSMDIKVIASCMTSLQVSTPSPTHAVPTQKSSPTAVSMKQIPPTAEPMQPSPPQALQMKASPPLVSNSSSPALPEVKTIGSSRIPPPQPSPSLYQLPPLPHLNFPLSPPKPLVSTPTSTSDQITSPVPSVSPSQAQAAPVKPPVKRRRRRAKTIRTTPPQYPPMTSEESMYPLTPPQFSQASYPVYPQSNHSPYPVSQYTPNGSHQASLQAYQNQMTMQLPFSTASQCLPQQQHQLSSSAPAPPVSTQSSIPPVSAPKTQKPTPQNKCQVCAMSFLTPIQLKLHHAVIHSNKTPSSAWTRPAATSPPTSSTSPSSSNQQNLSRPLLVPPPPLQERHQNAASLQRVPAMGHVVSTNIGTTTTWSNEPIQKRHCTGLSALASVIPTSFIPKSAQVAPVPVNNNNVNNSVNITQYYDSNLFSWLDSL